MSDYSEVMLAKLNPEAKLPADVYIFLNGKHVKFKQKGDTLSQEKYDLFLAKNVKSIYVESEHILEFLEWISDQKEDDIEDMVNNAGEENRGVIQDSLDMKEKVYEVFSDEKLTPEKVEAIQENVRDFVDKIKSDPITAQAIEAIMKRNDDIAAHSINVANLAVFLGMAVGHGHSFVLENLYMGAIFHDYGKAKIPPEIYNNLEHPDYAKWIHDHPENSVKIIRKSEGIPDQVFNIMLQHHEYYDGSGYPAGLRGSNIYSLAQIVSMANEIDNLLTKTKDEKDEVRYKKVIDMLTLGDGTKWDPKFFPRVTQAFKVGFLGDQKLT
ncbi:MAG: HD-GYP domain-containing protein (c-di-GMP phosphodiesterase class II) [Bacteriovoracaceae bacterium]|jgi:HD-GYP domain-containing protein (c-di-GMP phosphodiesterase class II)